MLETRCGRNMLSRWKSQEDVVRKARMRETKYARRRGMRAVMGARLGVTLMYGTVSSANAVGKRRKLRISG